MNNDIVKQLKKLGYKDLELETLLDQLPKNIWVTISTKNIKRREVFFLLKMRNKKYTLFLYTDDPEDGAVFLNKETGTTALESVAKMLVFINQSGLLTPIIEK